jgi:nitrogen regulatory protein P-II 1
VNSSSSRSEAHLLVCIVSNTAKVNEIIGRLAEIGVTGATVIDSHGTAQILAEQVPVFAGFRQLLRGDREANRTILSVVRDTETLERAMDTISEACGGFSEASTGIAFAVPVTQVRGLKPAADG